MVADLQLEIKGLPELYKKLGLDVLRVIEPGIASAVIRVERRMKTYPPAPTGSTYRRGLDPRSEHLGQRWTYQITRGAEFVRGEIGNNASYAIWVQSKEFQTRAHQRTGWITDEQALNEEVPLISADLSRRVIAAFGV